jgi:integrase
VSKQEHTTLSEGFAALLLQTEQRVRDRVRAAGTLEMQKGHARWWAIELGPDRPLTEIDEQLLDAVCARPRRAGPETLRKRLSSMSGMLRLAHRRRHIPRVPALPQVLVPFQQLARTISLADAIAIYKDLPPHRADFFWVTLWTGQRPHDVHQMTWGCVDLNGRSIMRRSTKTRRVPIRVETPAPLHRVLRARFERERPRPGDKLVRPWHSRAHTLHLRCYRLGIPPICATTLRHTCVTWMVRRLGITPAVSSWFGTSVAVLEKHYAHVLPPQLRECTAQLDSVEPEFLERAATTGGEATQ